MRALSFDRRRFVRARHRQTSRWLGKYDVEPRAIIALSPAITANAQVLALLQYLLSLQSPGAYRAKPESRPPALIVAYGGLPEAHIREAVRQLALALAESGEPYRRQRF
jgi:hypothetical protein